MIDAERNWNQLMELATIGRGENGGVTRISLTPEDIEARALLVKWMTEAGLVVRVDGAGNIIGRLEGEDPSLPVIMSGSHIDSVLNGGAFDGPLGVLGALEATRVIQERGIRLKRSFEIVSFLDEEGARFPTGLVGSKAMTGVLHRDDLNRLIDREGISYAQAFSNAGLDLELFETAVRSPGEIKAFVELHIEQGKVLESQGLSVGVVTGIAGPMWLEVVIRGEAGHAGTTPMQLRQDPGVGAGEMLLQIEQIAHKCGGVATVGRIEFEPGGANIIPSLARFCVDMRHIHQEKRKEMYRELELALHTMCENRSLSYELKVNMDIEPVLCSSWITEIMKDACGELGFEPSELVSGAGHDAMNMARIADVGMIFIRSKDGISHNPKEWSSPEDVADGVSLLTETLIRLGME